MNEYITVQRESTDPMVRWEWKFYYRDGVLWLDFYGEYERPTKRHKFKLTELYNRLSSRDSTIKEADVVLPAAVAEEAIKKFIEGITVKRWSDRKA